MYKNVKEVMMNIQMMAQRFTEWQRDTSNREQYCVAGEYDASRALLGFLGQQTEMLRAGLDITELRALASLLQEEAQIEQSEKLSTIMLASPHEILRLFSSVLSKNSASETAQAVTISPAIHHEVNNFFTWFNSEEVQTCYPSTSNPSFSDVLKDFIDNASVHRHITNYQDFLAFLVLLRADARLVQSGITSLQEIPNEEYFNQRHQRHVQIAREQRVRHILEPIPLMYIIKIVCLLAILAQKVFSKSVMLACKFGPNANFSPNFSRFDMTCMSASEFSRLNMFFECLKKEKPAQENYYHHLIDVTIETSDVCRDPMITTTDIFEKCAKLSSVKGNFTKLFFEAAERYEQANNTHMVTIPKVGQSSHR